jgi:formate-nitrite transporter family protein
MDKDLKAKEQEKEIYRRAAPPGQVVYEAIHEEADHELGRDSAALAWSGLAAGLSMGFSIIVQGLLMIHLPEAPWRPLLTRLGYTVGFLIVILARQQLFTENTLTPVLPLLRKPSGAMFLNVARLWAVVLVTNLVGGFILAWVVAHTNLLSAEARHACEEVARETLRMSFGTAVLRAIVAGWLIATMVWLLPFAETARVWVIIIVSYLVGLGEFPHLIAGGIANLLLVATGEISLGRSLGEYLAPVLIGNVIGGVSLVAALAHAQFMAAGRGENSPT